MAIRNRQCQPWVPNECRDPVFRFRAFFALFMREASLNASARVVSTNSVSQAAFTNAPMLVPFSHVLPRLARACALARQSANHQGTSTNSAKRVCRPASVFTSPSDADAYMLKRCFRPRLRLKFDSINFTKLSRCPRKKVKTTKLPPRRCESEEC